MQTPEEFHFHSPSIIKRIGEKIRIYEVIPADIVPENELGQLLKTYRDLAGDPDIGFGNDGYCQSWRGDPFWWKSFLKT